MVICKTEFLFVLFGFVCLFAFYWDCLKKKENKEALCIVLSDCKAAKFVQDSGLKVELISI